MDTVTTEIYTLSLHDALPISEIISPEEPSMLHVELQPIGGATPIPGETTRSEEHTSELQSLRHLVCRLLLEKKKLRDSASHPSATHRTRQVPAGDSRRNATRT